VAEPKTGVPASACCRPREGPSPKSGGASTRTSTTGMCLRAAESRRPRAVHLLLATCGGLGELFQRALSFRSSPRSLLRSRRVSLRPASHSPSQPSLSVLPLSTTPIATPTTHLVPSPVYIAYTVSLLDDSHLLLSRLAGVDERDLLLPYVNHS
jgi:hypothetical protein